MRYKELIESTGCGDCFVVAGRNMIDEMIPGITLVHALVYGQGALKGRRFPHAWNEIGDIVLDYSNGKKIVMRKEAYYKSGKINPNETGSYSVFNKTAALKKMVVEKHWGPWDLDPSLEK